jgi:hypothetical protein
VRMHEFHNMHHTKWKRISTYYFTARGGVSTGGGGRKMGLWRPLQFHSTTQSHWSTVCFPSNGSVLCILGMHKLTMEPCFSC